MSRVYNFVVSLRGQLWILPALMSASALLLAYAILGAEVDLSEPRGTDLWWLYSGDASTALARKREISHGLAAERVDREAQHGTGGPAREGAC